MCYNCSWFSWWAFPSQILVGRDATLLFLNGLLRSGPEALVSEAAGWISSITQALYECWDFEGCSPLSCCCFKLQPPLCPMLGHKPGIHASGSLCCLLLHLVRLVASSELVIPVSAWAIDPARVGICFPGVIKGRQLLAKHEVHLRWSLWEGPGLVRK